MVKPLAQHLWLRRFSLAFAFLLLPVALLMAFGPIRVGSRKVELIAMTIWRGDIGENIPQGCQRMTASGPPPLTYYDDLASCRVGPFWFALHIYNWDR
jgi:hypothetical protein